MAKKIADFMFNKAHDEDAIDPLVAVLRSAGSPSITPAIKHIFEEKIFDRLAGQLPAPSARQQAALIVSLLFGFDSLRQIFGVADLTRHDKKIASSSGAYFAGIKAGLARYYLS